LDGLIRFEALKATANAAQTEAPSGETFPSEQIIHQLRQRLISPDCRDPVEVKIAILGEIVCACYHQLLKKRTL
jgi:hypothetical protein